MAMAICWILSLHFAFIAAGLTKNASGSYWVCSILGLTTGVANAVVRSDELCFNSKIKKNFKTRKNTNYFISWPSRHARLLTGHLNLSGTKPSYRFSLGWASSSNLEEAVVLSAPFRTGLILCSGCLESMKQIFGSVLCFGKASWSSLSVQIASPLSRNFLYHDWLSLPSCLSSLFGTNFLWLIFGRAKRQSAFDGRSFIWSTLLPLQIGLSRPQE